LPTNSGLGISRTRGRRNSSASASSAAASSAVNVARRVRFPMAAIWTGRRNATVEAGTPVPGVCIVRECSIEYVLDRMQEWKDGTQVLDDGKVIGTSISAV